MRKCRAIAALAFSFAVALSISATVGLSTSALADRASLSPPLAPIDDYGWVYISIGAGGEVHQLPTFNLGTLVDGSPFFSVEPNLLTSNGYATLGFRLHRNATPIWLGRKPRFEITLGYAQGTLRESQTGPQPARPLVFIDGTTTALGVFGAANWDTRLWMRYRGLDGAIRLKSDYHVGPSLYLSPSLAFIGGYSSTDIRVTRQQIVPAAGAFNHTLVERLKTTRLGGEAAVDMTWKPKPRWQLHAGVSAAGFYQMTSFRGRECFSALPGDVCNPTLIGGERTASDRAGRGAFRLGLRAGTTYDFGWFKLTTMGHGTWNSAVPGIRNPSCTTVGPPGLPNCAGSDGPARITHDGKWSYGGLIFVSIPFN